MEPTLALSAVETALRNAIRIVYPQSGWLQAEGAPSRDDLERKRDEENKKRDGYVPPSSLLDFAYTYDLTGIVLKNWERFKPIFEDWQRTKTYFGIVEDVRNAIAHSRPLVQFERDLIAGIAGQLGNLVSIYSSKADGSRDFYPTIESLRDGFGNDGRPFQWGSDDPSRQRLNVGQLLHFSGRAVDPRDRGISWTLLQERTPFRSATTTAIGEDEILEFDYEVTDKDVRENFNLQILLTGNSSFHRRLETYPGAFLPHDDERCFGYRVNPPDWEYPPLYPEDAQPK